MTADQAMATLKERTGLEVAPHSIVAAIESQPGDVEAAVKQVIDWFVSGESRSKKAGTLLLAALRSQARSAKPEPAPRQMLDPGKVAELRRLVPGEYLPFVYVAAEVVRYRGEQVTAESVWAQLEATGRTTAQSEAGAA